jgi:two-component system sensor histidine kinase ResE
MRGHSDRQLPRVLLVDSAAVRVDDKGHGIPESDLEQVFDVYFTSKREVNGTGLGFSVVKQIVEDYRGHVRVDSQLGEGSTFTFTLPLRAQRATAIASDTRRAQS